MSTKKKTTKPPAGSDLDEAALFFHRYPTPGKLEIQATKPLGNQRDLALAYSPGVAAPCLAIHENPSPPTTPRGPTSWPWFRTGPPCSALDIGPLASSR